MLWRERCALNAQCPSKQGALSRYGRCALHRVWCGHTAPGARPQAAAAKARKANGVSHAAVAQNIWRMTGAAATRFGLPHGWVTAWIMDYGKGGHCGDSRCWMAAGADAVGGERQAGQ
jgi:hypothetical protein